MCNISVDPLWQGRGLIRKRRSRGRLGVRSVEVVRYRRARGRPRRVDNDRAGGRGWNWNHDVGNEVSSCSLGPGPPWHRRGRGEISLFLQNIFVVFSHFLCIVDGDEFLHICEGSVAGSDRVTIEEGPEGVTRGVTLIQGGEHPLNNTA